MLLLSAAVLSTVNTTFWNCCKRRGNAHEVDNKQLAHLPSWAMNHWPTALLAVGVSIMLFLVLTRSYKATACHCNVKTFAAQCPQSSNCARHRLGRCADTLEDAAAELQSVITVVEATSQPMSRRDPMRTHMDVIYKYAQDKSPFKPSMVPRVTPSTYCCTVEVLTCQGSTSLMSVVPGREAF